MMKALCCVLGNSHVWILWEHLYITPLPHGWAVCMESALYVGTTHECISAIPSNLLVSGNIELSRHQPHEMAIEAPCTSQQRLSGRAKPGQSQLDRQQFCVTPGIGKTIGLEGRSCQIGFHKRFGWRCSATRVDARVYSPSLQSILVGGVWVPKCTPHGRLRFGVTAQAEGKARAVSWSSSSPFGRRSASMIRRTLTRDVRFETWVDVWAQLWVSEVPMMEETLLGAP